jgi:hypothetical protein
MQQQQQQQQPQQPTDKDSKDLINIHCVQSQKHVDAAYQTYLGRIPHHSLTQYAVLSATERQQHSQHGVILTDLAQHPPRRAHTGLPPGTK